MHMSLPARVIAVCCLVPYRGPVLPSAWVSMVPLATYPPHDHPSLLAQLVLARHHDDSQGQ
jgi:hypothetical protein